ncbi:MAG: PD40 domain-containing protein [Anaerolineae bacterium]|nr:PD40 domain-containing protein [Anaerolineae bacterium]
MSNQNERKSVCPYLGLANDRASHFSYPENSHCCFVNNKQSSITVDHQSNFCLNSNHLACSRYIDFDPDLLAKQVSASSDESSDLIKGKTFIWTAVGIFVSLLIIGGVIYFSNQVREQEQVSIAIESTGFLPNSTPTSFPVETDELEELPTSTESTSDSSAFLATPTSTATPLLGSKTIVLSPESSDVGWVTSGDSRGNNFGDSYIYAGIFDGQVYNGAFQFDLSSVSRGAPIYQAELQLTGLNDERLGINRDETNSAGWAVKMLDGEIDESWRSHDYQTIFNANALQVLSPILGIDDLGAGKINSFYLSPDQIEVIKSRITDNEIPTISFRVDGPVVGSNTLFAWDSGYGPSTQGNIVKLILEVGEPPATPPPYKYVLVTSTATPENIVTVAAIALQQTAEATRVGTATPLPSNAVTPTPFPDYLVLVPTSTPENGATAQFLGQIATAESLLYGTATPFSEDAITATPIPTETPTPIPTPIQYKLITDTPTPSSVFAAATLSAQSTAQAQQYGTPTPLPENWATPIVVTSVPTPINAETAQAINAESTAIAFTTGTPVPTPNNVVTATPTAVYEVIPFLLTPTSTAPTAIPRSMPPELIGKILFKSNREEGSDTSIKIYVYDPETGELGRLTDTWPYDVAEARDAWSADNRYRAFTKDAIRYSTQGATGKENSVRTDAPAVYAYDYLYKEERQLTDFGTGLAYNGVWSPTKELVAFVSNDSSDDEIWVVDYLSGELKQLTTSNEEYNAKEIGKDTFIPEINKHPSWSPDGTQIIFGSTRSGNYQLWIMNANGDEQQLLMGWDNWTPYNDWDPVWVKYLDPSPSLD